VPLGGGQMRAMSGKARTALIAGVIVLVAAGAFAFGRLASDSTKSPASEQAASSESTKSAAASEASAAFGTSPPAAVAEPGAELSRLSTPPEKSLWAFAAGTYEPGVRIAIEFEPYGVGPSSFGASVVALVSSAEPEDSSAKAPDLAGRNVVLILGDSVVDAGGRYEGVAVTQAQGDRVVLVLEDVAPLREE